ncbi:hypothetical protein KR032_003652 [Drosophila birchii]|nr:hypothetical protein KR032_003652 [Drosophila birchii]
MGLKRFVSSMLRSAQLRSNKVGELAAGCPPVFNQNGMWTAMVQRQMQNKPGNGPGGKPQDHHRGLEQQQSGPFSGGSEPTAHRLPRKRCWLTKRKDIQLQKKQ